ncbi:hypothetical protein A2153_03985 [Candidatus Gottesmanbacteria bacterium RBG_16_38_7b]|uniref:Uncharacterized protein n=1 Tax=Candidatus Gottesmanbacteria bacterium RBG_16_38_7b TaxID=1798372 RepID=A0A1F5YFF5_9BACT|nr:MAG: hypothetical protein A2153_03985 [Candidatus Gottesmanbacteria bacterium RBG_16_38_7b]
MADIGRDRLSLPHPPEINAKEAGVTPLTSDELRRRAEARSEKLARIKLKVHNALENFRNGKISENNIESLNPSRIVNTDTEQTESSKAQELLKAIFQKKQGIGEFVNQAVMTNMQRIRRSQLSATQKWHNLKTQIKRGVVSPNLENGLKTLFCQNLKRIPARV